MIAVVRDDVVSHVHVDIPECVHRSCRHGKQQKILVRDMNVLSMLRGKYKGQMFGALLAINYW